jgi:hypothetical protein
MAFNVVELMDFEDDGGDAFDQPCKFGHRCGGHAVYCHNDGWADSPRKCRRTWATGGETKDEDCPGFQPNPAFTGVFSSAEVALPLCGQCGGTKLIKADRDQMETCPRCMGDGSEPAAMALSVFAQDTLEMCCPMSGREPAQFENNVRVAETKDEGNDMHMLADEGLIKIRAITGTNSGAMVYLYQMTAKGNAVMRANWAAAKDD